MPKRTHQPINPGKQPESYEALKLLAIHEVQKKHNELPLTHPQIAMLFEESMAHALLKEASGCDRIKDMLTKILKQNKKTKKLAKNASAYASSIWVKLQKLDRAANAIKKAFNLKLTASLEKKAAELIQKEETKQEKRKKKKRKKKRAQPTADNGEAAVIAPTKQAPTEDTPPAAHDTEPTTAEAITAAINATPPPMPAPTEAQEAPLSDDEWDFVNRSDVTTDDEYTVVENEMTAASEKDCNTGVNKRAVKAAAKKGKQGRKKEPYRVKSNDPLTDESYIDVEEIMKREGPDSGDEGSSPQP